MTVKTFILSGLALGTMLMASAPAHTQIAKPLTYPETTLFTPPLVPDGANQLDCYLVNVGSKVRQAKIQVLNRDGAVLNSVKVTLKPGTEQVVTEQATKLPRYCKFIVEGSKTEFRASILVRKQGEGSISALSAE